MKITHLKKFYREDLPKLIKKKNLIGVELGVARGDFSKQLINSNKFKFLFGVDSYSLKQHNKNEYKYALKSTGIFSNYKLLNMTFDDALSLFPDNSIDFIYFDGFAHTGQDYGKTLIKWSKKIKHNGILSGDITYKQIAVFEGGIINVAGMKQIDLASDKVVEIMQKVSD